MAYPFLELVEVKFVDEASETLTHMPILSFVAHQTAISDTIAAIPSFNASHWDRGSCSFEALRLSAYRKWSKI